MSIRTRITATVGALLVLASSAPAMAAVVPINPGPIGHGRPIVGTTQNLPPIGATSTYDAGPGFADTINAYYQSGQALKDQQAVAAAAKKWIRTYAAKHCKGKHDSCKAMVVFDIDDTLESNYSTLTAEDPAFGYNQAAWDAAVASCSMPIITPVAQVFHEAQRLGLSVGIVTGRSESARADTITCLNKAGLSGWADLVTRNAANASEMASVYKSQQRAQWEKEGYTIVASIGDQVSDMALGHMMRGFLLPNPMYMIP